MDIADLPDLMETMGNKEKLDQINYIIKCSNEGLILFDEAETQINKIILAKGDEWKQ